MDPSEDTTMGKGPQCLAKPILAGVRRIGSNNGLTRNARIHLDWFPGSRSDNQDRALIIFAYA